MSNMRYDLTVGYRDGIQPEKDEQIRAIVAEHSAGFRAALLRSDVIQCGASARHRQLSYRLPDKASADAVAERLRALGYAVSLDPTPEPMPPLREPFDSGRIDDGGPAFPVKDLAKCQEHGMSLRDWFAGQAVLGLISGGEYLSISYVARAAYDLADAMLAERRKGGSCDSST